MARTRLIIDTDMGVDDAHALIMALTSPDVDILGITTVMGNVGLSQVVENVGHVLDLLKCDVPYFEGAENPLIGEPIPPSGLMGMDGLGDITEGIGRPEHQPDSENAVFALLRMVEENTGDGLTLVALGPLTNIALALRMNSDFVASVPRLVIMGGAYKAMGNASWTAEFNFFADPEAAKIVLEAGFCDVWILPWEVSVEQMVLWPEIEQWAALRSKRANFFRRMSGVSTTVLRNQFKLPGMPCPDQLAMAAALNPDRVIAESVELKAAVEVEGSIGRGMMALDWNHTDGAPNVHVITRVDQAAVIEMMKRCLE